ncbi:molybdopterin dinucleotide binding domain-containing protein [Methanolacinia paynteri]|uniref:molybdopterin dinucleotide binding domain-containing protein n=1 Tax=Methanolacinia paynteri TaxID=230356 RepID=UPI00064F7D36|nr:molybdopterin dinucleotide binding domain-containing protein [Methanolacinia paynteri]
MKYIMLTGRSIKQGESIEQKLSQNYSLITSTCFMNLLDMVNLELEDGENIRAISDSGSVVFHVAGDEGLKSGTVFIPYGPYCNMLISELTHGSGMPDFKSCEIEIGRTDENVLSVIDLLSEAGGKEL